MDVKHTIPLCLGHLRERHLLGNARIAQQNISWRRVSLLVWATACSTSSRDVTSTRNASALRARLRTSCAVSSAPAIFTSHTTTSAPPLASTKAVACPIPRACSGKKSYFPCNSRHNTSRFTQHATRFTHFLLRVTRGNITSQRCFLQSPASPSTSLALVRALSSHQRQSQVLHYH